MHRLLVVDDEPLVLNGICKHMQSAALPELELLRAGNAMEAIQWLERARIDIVLTDIQMPGMNGLELQQIIADRWPRCKVIFITGYNEFDYIHSALRQGAADYILKTEGYKEIVRIVERTLQSITEEWTNERLIELTRQKLHLVRPMLVRRLLNPYLRGQTLPKPELWEQFRLLELRLQPDMDVLMLMMRVDQWGYRQRMSDQSLLLFALQNIAEEYLHPKIELLPIEFDTQFPTWLIQPRCASGGQVNWKETISFVEGAAELIQAASRRLLQITVSVLLADRPVPWEELGERFYFMKRIFGNGFGQGEELLLRERDFDFIENGSDNPDSPDHARSHRHYALQQQLDRLPQLESYLDTGKEAELSKLLEALFQHLSATIAYHEPLADQAYFSITLVFANYLNRTGLARYLLEDINPARLMMKHDHTDWEYFHEYLQRLAGSIMKRKRKEQLHQSMEIIHKVQQYIRDHLHENVTLAKLAEVVYLNPSYLSRLYKQATSEGISDYISSVKIGKAKLLLKDRSLLIQDIAAMLGYESHSYFSNLFKRMTSLTPQEYRDALK